MANKKASLKGIRQAARRTVRNRAIVSRLRTQLKRVRASEGEEAKSAARVYVSCLDKAVKVGLVHRNKASRSKSALAQLVF
ncbi:MAG: 30S ribosomal protein S20 [Verrucomicrobiota bacterium]|nr:MAG: 30S ribosomal protein S20 [Verrucomicrobiota bacterium]